MKKLIKKLFVAIALFTAISTASRIFAQNSFLGVGDLPDGKFESFVSDVSADGSTVVGRSFYDQVGQSSRYQAFRWTQSTGMIGLGFLNGGMLSTAHAVSENGSAIVGWATSSNFPQAEAFRWVDSGSMVGLGGLPNCTSSSARGVAANGGVIVGESVANYGNGPTEAFFYLVPFGMTGLGFLPGASGSGATDICYRGDDALIVGASGGEAFYFITPGPMVGMGVLPGFETSSAAAISGNGNVIVGTCGKGDLMWQKGQAFRYSLSTGTMEGLGELHIDGSAASDVSGDGSIVVGVSGSLINGGGPFIWDSANGMRDLRTVMENEYGLDLTGWLLRGVQAISYDGKTIVGNGINPDGKDEGWVAKLVSKGGWLRVVDPNGEETLNGNSQYEIKWTSSGFIPPTNMVNILYSTTGYQPSTWGIIAQNTTDDGSFMWTVPNTTSSNCVIFISNAYNGDIKDVSDDPFTINPASNIIINEPDGGEKWYVGSTHEISWTNQNFTDNVKIEYSTNGGSTYITLEGDLTNTGSYDWDIPNDPSTHCRVRVSDTADGFPSDISDADFTILSANLTLISPNGGEKWKVDTTQAISWTSQNIPDNDVTIEYSTNNGQSYTTIGVHTNNESTESWLWSPIPNTPSTNCLVRISLYMQNALISDVSEAVFEITSQKPSITVTAPDGGEDWKVGSSHNITWSSQDFSDPVKIEYSTDGGSTYKIEKNSTPNTGTYSWLIPNSPSVNCLVRVSDAADGNPFDISNTTFTISESGNTQPGFNVTIDVGNGVKVTFENVTGEGNTTLDIKYSGPPPPDGFKIMPTSLPVYFDINSTADSEGDITICIPYNDIGMSPTEEANLKLMVYEVPPGQWKDITKPPVDVNNNIICGKVNHLTYFAIMLGPVHFNFTSNTGESYSIVIENATLDGNSLQVDDEIGVFTPAGLCVGASVWDGNTPLALTAWADDSQTGVVDGYNNGEKMYFRIWDSNAGTADDYSALPAYSTGNGNFGNGTYAQISTLTAVTSVTQTISLAQGWSWISFNVLPSDLSLQSVMTNVDSLEIVVNGAGEFYIPNVINGIGQINILEGYKIYVNLANQLSVTGSPVDATTPINLVAGWNFISYLPTNSMPVETALASILSQVVIVKNDDGNFFIPNVINSLGNMTTGDGYKLYSLSDTTLRYPGGGNLTKNFSTTPCVKNIRPRHFQFRAKTGENFCLVVQSINIENSNLKIGDEVGVLTASGLCVGAGVWDGSGGIMAIPAWADDDQTDEKDGFSENEDIYFRYWDSERDAEINVTPIFTNGNGGFGAGAYGTVNLESFKVPRTFKLDQNYPNPFNSGTVITFHLPQAEKVVLKVYSLLGEEVRTLLVEEKNAGLHRAYWDGKNDSGETVPSGVYIYQLKTGNLSSIKKAVFVK